MLVLKLFNLKVVIGKDILNNFKKSPKIAPRFNIKNGIFFGLEELKVLAILFANLSISIGSKSAK
jgi:alpha-D-ribose 1-methylphosphonate 5-triphosphate synthase subunit PhnI